MKNRIMFTTLATLTLFLMGIHLSPQIKQRNPAGLFNYLRNCNNSLKAFVSKDELIPVDFLKRIGHTEINFESDHWWKMFVRNPEDGMPKKDYIENNTHAMVELHQWFSSSEIQDFEAFKRMLKKQHVIMVKGAKGKSRYTGVSAKSSVNQIGQVNPGHFVYELNSDNTVYTVLLDGKKSGLKLTDAGRKERKVKIEGIPLRAWPKIFEQTSRANHKVKHLKYKYTRAANIDLYLEQVHAKAIDLDRILSLDTFNEQEFIETLSDYYHIAAHTHPFIKVNNSIFMGHVNYYLMRAGLNGIPHSNLDYRAFIKSTERYRKVFKKVIKAENPNLDIEIEG